METHPQEGGSVGAPVLETNTVHQSLVRSPLFAGVEFGILLMEVGISVALLFVANFSPMAILPCLLVGLGIHIPIRRLLRSDPQFLQVLAASLPHRVYYGPVSDIRVPLPKRRSCISTKT
ncbi:MAG: VirB3 family type IV secretion system protein [Candidatus Nitrospinota bacterium M3_3B_026]|jgi:type IV secretory pathway TrbD component